jgi:hypothetical protein
LGRVKGVNFLKSTHMEVFKDQMKITQIHLNFSLIKVISQLNRSSIQTTKSHIMIQSKGFIQGHQQVLWVVPNKRTSLINSWLAQIQSKPISLIKSYKKPFNSRTWRNTKKNKLIEIEGSILCSQNSKKLLIRKSTTRKRFNVKSFK